MGDINDAFPSRYIKASDLKGTQPIVTMDRVEYEEIGQGSSKDRKPILYFLAKTKGLVLNKTNANKIIEIAGSPVTEEWHGVQIQLFATHVEFQGDTVEAIRVRAPKTAKATAKKPVVDLAAEEFGSSEDDPIPF